MIIVMVVDVVSGLDLYNYVIQYLCSPMHFHYENFNNLLACMYAICVFFICCNLNWVVCRQLGIGTGANRLFSVALLWEKYGLRLVPISPFSVYMVVPAQFNHNTVLLSSTNHNQCVSCVAVVLIYILYAV
jgi:hypothetical protein